MILTQLSSHIVMAIDTLVSMSWLRVRPRPKQVRCACPGVRCDNSRECGRVTTS